MMMPNDRCLRFTVFLMAIFAAMLMLTAHGCKSRRAETVKSPGVENSDIDYWTCSMHPDVHKDKPGDCPICGMELVPVYKQEKGKIVLDEKTAHSLGIKSEPAMTRHLMKDIKLPGRISHDYELYILQQKHLSALLISEKSDERSILEMTLLKLKQLGFDDDEIKKLGLLGKPDESLIYPSKGRVWAHADIYEQDLNQIKPGQSIVAAIEGYKDKEFTGKIVAIETTLNSATRSAKARIEIDDPQNKLRHEMYADIMLKVDMGNRFSIPKQSLIDTGTRKIVYLNLGDGRYEMREVTTGGEAQGFMEILSGIRDGESVVTDGNFLLDSQMTLTRGQSLQYDAGEEIEKPKHSH